MADNWRIDKWKEDLTPKRAIKNFFLHATPVDSPNPDELVQLTSGSTSELNQNGTPIACSSQSRKPGYLKRKLNKSEKSPGNVSKKNLTDETQIFSDSSFDKSEIPSQLESPSIVIPQRPSIKNKKQISTRSYTQVLQSQQYQKIKKTSIVDCLDESSIASEISSPTSLPTQKAVSNNFNDSEFSTETSDQVVTLNMTSNKTELPSQLESPSIVNNKQMSTSPYTQAIQSHQLQKSKENEIADFLDESSISSGIGGPNEIISQQLGESKVKVSMSVNIESLAEKNVQEVFRVSSSLASNKSTRSSSRTNSVDSNKSAELSGSLPSTSIVSSEGTIVISNSSSSDAVVNRSRSLKFVHLSGKSISEEILTPNEEPLSVAEVEVEETPPSYNESGEERDDPATPDFSSESYRSSIESVKTAMSPTNRYPALKNSTVVAGGAPFLGAPLSMSPIRLGEKETPLTVPSTPTTPTLTRKPIRSVAQSPMFLNVMQKAISKTVLKAYPKHSDATIHTSPSLPLLTRASSTPTSIFPDSSSGTKSKSLATPPPLIASSSTPVSKTATSSTLTSSSVMKRKTFATSENAFGAKKSILSNPGKGKYLALQMLDEMPDESSDTEWEDFERDLKVKPLAIKIAFEEIEDRSKDFGLPLEERLKNDPIFQAKVKSQRARLAAQKVVEEAVLAKKKLTQTKSRKVATKKTPKADNIASEAINKANLRFYARTKLSKEALESVHDLVGEWFDFTVDQMELFCQDEGISALETWEDCMKMLKRQKMVKNYADYSGLCHELLLNDECAKLLPSEFPPGHYERKREAKIQSK